MKAPEIRGLKSEVGKSGKPKSGLTAKAVGKIKRLTGKMATNAHRHTEKKD